MRNLSLLIFVSVFSVGVSFAQVTKGVGTLKTIDASKIASGRGITRGAAIAAGVKLQKAKELTKGKMPTVQSLTIPVSLTPRDSFIDGKAFLQFNFPSEVSAVQNKAFFSPADKTDPRLLIGYNAPSPGFYLFDVTLEAYPSSGSTQKIDALTFSGSGGSQSVAGGSVTHAFYAVEFKTAGWNAVLVQSEGSWNFYSVEVSKVN